MRSALALGFALSGALVACGGAPEMDAGPATANAPTEPMDAVAGMQANALSCPPQGPFGTREGRTIPNVILEDCDGKRHQLHDLCGKRASWFFIYAGW